MIKEMELSVKKSVLYILLICGMISTVVQADEGGKGGGVATSLREEMAKVFPQNDSVVSGGSCSFECRKVNGGYGTQIVGYDFTNGVTFCSVFKLEDQEIPLKFNANKQNLQCMSQAIAKATRAPVRNKDTNVKSSITQTISDSEITLARFLSSLAVLDPNIIDREATANTGQITLMNGIRTRGSVGGIYKFSGYDFLDKTLEYVDMVYSLEKEPQPLGSGETISMADKFNKANMAYFSNLYHNMKDIYFHLQNLLFVVIGGFFLSTLGFAKIQTYLEHKGQGGSNQPYLHKFLIPLVATAFFYMPIPEAKNESATAIQKIIRYFTIQANNIADLASSIGGATYMNKLFASVGGITQEGENALRLRYAQAVFTYNQAQSEYARRCSTRYQTPNGIPYSAMPEKELKDLLEKWDIKQVAGTSNDISFQTCIYLENLIADANSKMKELDRTIKAIDKYYANNTLQTRLIAIDKYTANREKEYGWINSILLPATGLMVELQDYITDNAVQPPDELAISAEKSRVANKDSITKGEVVDGLKSSDNLKDKVIGFVMGRLAYFIIPGTSGIYEVVKGGFENLGKVFNKVPGVEGIAAISGSIVAFLAATYLVELMLNNIPTLVATVAGSIAFVGYLVSLVKYFYISPFVIAFALTTKRYDKIIGFLITGITIFFKPILIVMFIYLALFLNTIINELFIVFSIEQFGAIKLSSYDFIATFGITAIQAMLKIFGVLASSYIMWRTIINGAEWTFGLLGLDNKTDNVVSQGLAQRLEQRSFMA